MNGDLYALPNDDRIRWLLYHLRANGERTGNPHQVDHPRV